MILTGHLNPNIQYCALASKYVKADRGIIGKKNELPLGQTADLTQCACFTCIFRLLARVGELMALGARHRGCYDTMETAVQQKQPCSLYASDICGARQPDQGDALHPAKRRKLAWAKAHFALGLRNREYKWRYFFILPVFFKVTVKTAKRTVVQRGNINVAGVA
jgi:hypothetical protein